MRGGKASRRKGDRFEREIVALFQAHGIAAERVPLSGAAIAAAADLNAIFAESAT